VALAMRFRDDFVANHEQHGACGKSQAPGLDLRGHPDHRGADHRIDWLDQTGGHTDSRGEAAGNARQRAARRSQPGFGRV